MGTASATVVAQEFQPGLSDAGLAESCLNRFPNYVAHGLARQATVGPSPLGNDFAVSCPGSITEQAKNSMRAPRERLKNS